jgi:hypothetical protein
MILQYDRKVSAHKTGTLAFKERYVIRFKAIKGRKTPL